MFKKILKYKLVSTLSLVSVLFILGGFAWAYFTLRAIGGGPFILHFNDIEGITSVGGLGTIVFAGVFGIIAVIMNFFIALEFEERDRFLGKFLAVMTLLFGILLFIAFVAILSVN